MLQRPRSLLLQIWKLAPETEQNSEAILEQLRDERYHSQSMVMALGRSIVLAMQERQKVIPLVALYMA